MKLRTPLLLSALLFIAGRFLVASEPEPPSNWGQWRGPDATGAAPESAAPPLEWSEDKNVKWKVRIPGEGSGSAVVWGDKIFVQTAVKAGASLGAALRAGEEESPEAVPEAPRRGPSRRGDRGGRPGRGGIGGGRGGGAPTEAYQFKILCLDRESGAVHWDKIAAEVVPHEGHHQNHAYGSHTAITDGKHVYAWFGSRGLYCYDFDGKLVWEKQLGQKTMRAGFGEGNSIALHEDKLIVNWDHEGPSFIVALDKATGEEVWRKDRDELSTWSTPLVVVHEGKAQVVTNGETAVRSYDLETGELLWTSTGQTTRPVATPVSDGEHVFVMSGYRGSKLSALRLGTRDGGDLTGTDAEFWSLSRDTPDVASPLLSKGRLYFFSGKGTFLSCYRAATGEKLYGPERIEGLRDIYSSPVSAGGRVYFTVRDGTTIVLEESDDLRVLATNRLDDEIDGTPAMVDKEIFLRGKRYLYCLAEN